MKKALLFSVSIIAAFLANGQKKEPLQNTLLWKVSGNGLAQPSYLFGTMHVLCADDSKLSDSLQNIIKRSDEIYFEVDLGDMKGMMAAMNSMRMSDSKKLSDILTAADYEKVKSYFAKHSSMLPFAMLERFKPLLISSLIEEEGLGCPTTNGMELVIMKQANEDHKKINGLETAEFQAGLFDSIPYEEQAKNLVNSIDSIDQNKKMTSQLVEVYKNQDLEKIDLLTHQEDQGVGDYLDLLLYGRNRKWVGILQNILPQKSLLIAVGAGHLPGDQGLINLLRKKGYTVSPVKN